MNSNNSTANTAGWIRPCHDGTHTSKPNIARISATNDLINIHSRTSSFSSCNISWHTIQPLPIEHCLLYVKSISKIVLPLSLFSDCRARSIVKFICSSRSSENGKSFYLRLFVGRISCLVVTWFELSQYVCGSNRFASRHYRWHALPLNVCVFTQMVMGIINDTYGRFFFLFWRYFWMGTFLFDIFFWTIHFDLCLSWPLISFPCHLLGKCIFIHEWN